MDNVKDKTVINYTIRTNTKKNVIRLLITGSDLDLNNEENLKFFKDLTNEFCTLLFAQAHNIAKDKFIKKQN